MKPTILIALLAAGVSSAAAQPQAVSAQGPLPVTATSYPFGAASETRTPSNLKAIGYVEEEFLVSGRANVYDWPQAGAAVVRTPNAPYTTRVLVRRPADRARFSGTILVEMLNPSNLFDLNIGWAVSHAEIVREGHAWVGITAKPVAIATLKAFNADRYAMLSWANPLELNDPENCQTVARDSDRATENGLVWDIHRQVATWLRARGGKNPFDYGTTSGPHPAQRLIAWGYSQTGSYLYTYVNAIHPLDVKELGKPLFDAYLVAVASGPTPINQCAGPIPADDPRRAIAASVTVPVIRVMSQSDYLPSVRARLADSDQPLRRNYEIAGSGHATPDELTFAAKPADIEKGGRAVPPMACNEGPRSRFPSSVAFNAILHNLDAAVRKGIPPPPGQSITVVDGKPALDRFGNVEGGVRSPFVDVPTSTWNGNSTGESFCRIAGHEKPFDAARIKELYPAPGDYARAVEASVKKLVAARMIVEADGQQLVAAARTQRDR